MTSPDADSYRYVVADVFTDTPLTGNQLAVFTDARGLDDATMQALAREIGFSETVFVLPPRAGRHGADPDLQPRAHEMPFAGHPTLGAAFVLGRAAPARRHRARDRSSGPCPSCSSATSRAGSSSAA